MRKLYRALITLGGGLVGAVAAGFPVYILNRWLMPGRGWVLDTSIAAGFGGLVGIIFTAYITSDSFKKSSPRDNSDDEDYNTSRHTGSIFGQGSTL